MPHLFTRQSPQFIFVFPRSGFFYYTLGLTWNLAFGDMNLGEVAIEVVAALVLLHAVCWKNQPACARNGRPQLAAISQNTGRNPLDLDFCPHTKPSDTITAAALYAGI